MCIMNGTIYDLQVENVGQMSEQQYFGHLFLYTQPCNALFGTAAPDYQVQAIRTFPDQPFRF